MDMIYQFPMAPYGSKSVNIDAPLLHDGASQKSPGKHDLMQTYWCKKRREWMGMG